MNSIPVTNEVIDKLREVLSLVLVKVRINSKMYDVAFSGYSGEMLPFRVYPVVIEKPLYAMDPRAKYVVGVSSPNHVFGAIYETFKHFFPEDNQEHLFYDFDLLKYNRIMYGKPALDKMRDPKVTSCDILYSRSFTGNNPARTVLWVNEYKLKRFQIAVPIKNVFPGANTLPEECLAYMVDKAANVHDDKTPDKNLLDEFLFKAEQATDKNMEIDCIVKETAGSG